MIDSIAMNALKKYGLSRYGIEFGNWYGFVGIPLNYGLCSFVEIEDVNQTRDKYEVIARIKMPYLHVRIKYQTYKIEGGIITELRVKALEDSLLGDIVIHSVFDDQKNTIKFNDLQLQKLKKYYYSSDTCNQLHIDEHTITIDMHLEDCESSNLISMPYAAILDNNKIRYHTRAISMGGGNSQALLRTRGSLSCFNLGKYIKLYDTFLYRVEKLKPKLLRNTQICSVTKLRSNDEIMLKHKIIIT